MSGVNNSNETNSTNGTPTQDQETHTQTPRYEHRPREKIYLSHKPGGVWWDDKRISDLLGFSFTSTYGTYFTNWTDCPPSQRDVMFEYFQNGVRTDDNYDLRKAYEHKIKSRITTWISRVANSENKPVWMPIACFERLLQRKNDPNFINKSEKSSANRKKGGKDGPSATPHKLFLASKKKGDKFINPRCEEIDAEYTRIKAMLEAEEITLDEFKMYLKATGGFDKKKRLIGMGGVARELFIPPSSSTPRDDSSYTPSLIAQYVTANSHL